jgi:hypothetical protein
MAAADAGLGGGLYADDPPAALPTNLTAYYMNETLTLVGLQWVNGDPLASTDVGRNAGGDPTDWDSVGPGVAVYETGEAYATGWKIRHNRGGVAGAWVSQS